MRHLPACSRTDPRSGTCGLIGARYAGRIDGSWQRGFILSAPVAAELGLGMLTILGWQRAR